MTIVCSHSLLDSCLLTSIVTTAIMLHYVTATMITVLWSFLKVAAVVLIINNLLVFSLFSLWQYPCCQLNLLYTMQDQINQILIMPQSGYCNHSVVFCLSFCPSVSLIPMLTQFFNVAHRKKNYNLNWGHLGNPSVTMSIYWTDVGVVYTHIRVVRNVVR